MLAKRYVQFMRTTLYILTIVFLSSCNQDKKETRHLNSPIKVFSTFNFNPGSDISSLNTWTYHFDGDTIFSMKTDSLRRHSYSKIVLSTLQIDSLNSIFKVLNPETFEAFEATEKFGSKTLDTNNLTHYCGPAHGFVNFQNDPFVYKPTGDEQYSRQITETLSGFLHSLNGIPTLDTLSVRKFAISIAEKYIKTTPPPPAPPLKEMVKFIPPDIKEEK